MFIVERLSHQHFFSAEDEGYIADIPDLAHCSAFGITPEKALSEALIAKKAWLDAACAEGKSIPRRNIALPFIRWRLRLDKF